jgi:hypothetical protein
MEEEATGRLVAHMPTIHETFPTFSRCGVLCTELGNEAFSRGPKGGVGASASSVFLEEIRMLIQVRKEGVLVGERREACIQVSPTCG